MYSSKKIKAIKALNIQKAKLDDPTQNNDWVWVAQTGDIVKKYIGEKSVLYANISTFTFTFWHLSGETDDGKRQQAKNFIDSCIEFINEQDIYKAQILTRLFDDVNKPNHFPRPFGVFYATQRTCYEDVMRLQIEEALAVKGTGDLDALLRGKDVWEISQQITLQSNKLSKARIILLIKRKGIPTSQFFLAIVLI